MNSPLVELDMDGIRRVLERYEPDTRPSEAASNHAAVAMTLRETDNGSLDVLFIKRAERSGDPWSGHMAFPGGRRESIDATLVAAAMRETEEEVGIVLSEERLVARLDDVGEGQIARFNLAVSCFVFASPPVEDLVLSDEVEATVWIPLSYLADVDNVQPYYFHLDPERRPFPSFRYEGYTVWGMTYRMLANFMRRFEITLPLEESSKEVE